MALRVLGDRSATELWLDRSEAGFRQTVNPSPLLANVTYQRLALRCEMGRYDEVVELVPLLFETFQRLQMGREQAKCLFLEAAAFKQSGRNPLAAPIFERVVADFGNAAPDIATHALIELGEMHVADGCDEEGARCFSTALASIASLKKPALFAHLQAVFGETLQRQGRLDEAIVSYQTALDAFEAINMRAQVAYLRLVLAQALLVADRPKEAEWQILAALPTIDSEKMLPEAGAAVNLLAESIRRRKLDSGALADVRNYLQKQG